GPHVDQDADRARSSHSPSCVECRRERYRKRQDLRSRDNGRRWECPTSTTAPCFSLLARIPGHPSLMTFRSLNCDWSADREKPLLFRSSALRRICPELPPRRSVLRP